MASQKNILVVGDAGGGKTSVINAATGECGEVHLYPRYIEQCTWSETKVTRNDCTYCFIEIVGFGAIFNDRNGGNGQSNIWEHLPSFARHDIKLILFVLRQGLITIESKNIFGMIRSDEYLQNVPKFCIITHCENEVDEDALILHCLEYFHHHRMLFDAFIPGCFAKGGFFEENLQLIRQQSGSAIWEEIDKQFESSNLPPSLPRGDVSMKRIQDGLDKLFDECNQISQLLFKNRFDTALEKAKKQCDESFYHSLYQSIIECARVGMTFDQNDIELALASSDQTVKIADSCKLNSFHALFFPANNSKAKDWELHAKLVKLEASLLQLIVSYFQEQTIFTLIRGAFRINQCHRNTIKLDNQYSRKDFCSSSSYEHFDSGMHLVKGAFNLILLHLPPNFLRFLRIVPDRKTGFEELKKSAESNGLRAPLSALIFLVYQIFVSQLLGNFNIDLTTCNDLVERYLKTYPDSYYFLFLKAKLQELGANIDKGIGTFQHALQLPNDWKRLHQIAHWELLWCYVLKYQWKEASQEANSLIAGEAWSPATYHYLLATFTFEDNDRKTTDEVVKLYQKVRDLKDRRHGQSIELEDYAIQQSERFLSHRWLFLPALEMLYIMHGFYIFAQNKDKRINQTLETVQEALADLERGFKKDQFYWDSHGSGLLLRGVLLRFLGQYDEALQDFDKIIGLKIQFDKKSFLPPAALLEKGLVFLNQGKKQAALKLLENHSYSNYQLEFRLQFRINAAIEKAKEAVD